VPGKLRKLTFLRWRTEDYSETLRESLWLAFVRPGSWQVVAEACVFRDIDLQFTMETPVPEAQPLGCPRASRQDLCGSFRKHRDLICADFFLALSKLQFQPDQASSRIVESRERSLFPALNLAVGATIRKEKLRNAVSAVFCLSRVRNQRRNEHYFSLTMSNWRNFESCNWTNARHKSSAADTLLRFFPRIAFIT